MRRRGAVRAASAVGRCAACARRLGARRGRRRSLADGMRLRAERRSASVRAPTTRSRDGVLAPRSDARRTWPTRVERLPVARGCSEHTSRGRVAAAGCCPCVHDVALQRGVDSRPPIGRVRSTVTRHAEAARHALPGARTRSTRDDAHDVAGAVGDQQPDAEPREPAAAQLAGQVDRSADRRVAVRPAGSARARAGAADAQPRVAGLRAAHRHGEPEAAGRGQPDARRAAARSTTGGVTSAAAAPGARRARRRRARSRARAARRARRARRWGRAVARDRRQRRRGRTRAAGPPVGRRHARAALRARRVQTTTARPSAVEHAAADGSAVVDAARAGRSRGRPARAGAAQAPPAARSTTTTSPAAVPWRDQRRARVVDRRGDRRGVRGRARPGPARRRRSSARTPSSAAHASSVAPPGATATAYDAPEERGLGDARQVADDRRAPPALTRATRSRAGSALGSRPEHHDVAGRADADPRRARRDRSASARGSCASGARRARRRASVTAVVAAARGEPGGRGPAAARGGELRPLVAASSAIGALNAPARRTTICTGSCPEPAIASVPSSAAATDGQPADPSSGSNGATAGAQPKLAARAGDEHVPRAGDAVLRAPAADRRARTRPPARNRSAPAARSGLTRPPLTGCKVVPARRRADEASPLETERAAPLQPLLRQDC